ncbi:MAG TPA: hypothetical protein VES03_07590 [Motilibacterales bacterium]|nr:hypothetical protein [Motilibacterales bacterium]
MIAMLLAGALVGLGVTLVIAGLRAPVPDLVAGVARLSGTGAVPHPATGDGPLDRALSGAAAHLADALRLERHRADLAITGMTPTRMALEKMAYAFVGLAFPVLLTSILSIVGLALPLVIPVAAAVGLAVGMSFLPELELRRRAAVARLQMRRTVCVYLELVALERAADAGAVESLERAAAIGDGPGFGHIRDALLRARLEGRTPWQQLSELALELGVPELGDVADIMRLSGEDGAAVLPTLRARAASLRTWLLQSEVTTANEASERMSIPVALLGVAFMALLGFPAFWRILFG